MQGRNQMNPSRDMGSDTEGTRRIAAPSLAKNCNKPRKLITFYSILSLYSSSVSISRGNIIFPCFHTYTTTHSVSIVLYFIFLENSVFGLLHPCAATGCGNTQHLSDQKAEAHDLHPRHPSK